MFYGQSFPRVSTQTLVEKEMSKFLDSTKFVNVLPDTRQHQECSSDFQRQGFPFGTRIGRRLIVWIVFVGAFKSGSREEVWLMGWVIL